MAGPPQFPVFHAVPIKLPSDCHELLHLSQWRSIVHICPSSPVSHWPALTLLRPQPSLSTVSSCTYVIML